MQYVYGKLDVGVADAALPVPTEHLVDSSVRDAFDSLKCLRCVEVSFIRQTGRWRRGE